MHGILLLLPGCGIARRPLNLVLYTALNNPWMLPLPGQKAPKEPAFEAPRKQGWSPFGAFVREGEAKISRTDKENQDGTMIKPYLYDGVSAFCVFDGHGENGAGPRPPRSPRTGR